MSEPNAPRHSLQISIHVPKTAGVRFAEILRDEYGKACALYYGPHDERTHPLLRVKPRELTADRLDALAQSGVDVLHGHIKARRVIEAIPDPQSYLVWLREPIEQTLSRYHTGEDGKRRTTDAKSVEAFAAREESANYQSAYIAPLKLHEIGFVGITELFEPMLALLELSDTAVRANVNVQKPVADLATRTRLVPHLREDVALYSQALELAVRNLGLRDVKQRARTRQSATELAKRFGADISQESRHPEDD
ncbi:MAG: hypothetical protein AAGF49_10490 [Pseudomonadota bacterium]